MGAISRTAGSGLAVVALVTMAPVDARASAVRFVPCDATLLANAVAAANSVPATLRLASYCTYDITAQLPQIIGAVTLVGGRSTTIRHDPGTAAHFRLLDVGATGTLRVLALALRNGNPAGDGGAIRNAGGLVLDRVTVAGNVAGNVVAPVGGNGGGLANLPGGRAVVARTVINGNYATRAPVETTTGNGGGILNAGRLTLFASRLYANNATGTSASAGTGNGGGINTPPGGRTLLVRDTLDENTATNNGGGIASFGATSVVRTLVIRDRAATGGGISGTVGAAGSIVRGNTPNNCVPGNPGCN